MKKTLIFGPLEIKTILGNLIPSLSEHGYSVGLGGNGDYLRITLQKLKKFQDCLMRLGTLPQK